MTAFSDWASLKDAKIKRFLKEIKDKLCTKAPVVWSVIKLGNLPKVAWKGRISWIPQMSCLRIGSDPLD